MNESAEYEDCSGDNVPESCPATCVVDIAILCKG